MLTLIQIRMAVPWSEKHSRFTLMFEAFAIEVLKMAGSLEAGRVFLELSWDSAHAIMERAVERGLSRREISEVEHIGIDEKSFLKGHNYLTSPHSMILIKAASLMSCRNAPRPPVAN